MTSWAPMRSLALLVAILNRAAAHAFSKGMSTGLHEEQQTEGGGENAVVVGGVDILSMNFSCCVDLPSSSSSTVF